MTKDEKRIKIAEACGWTRIHAKVQNHPICGTIYFVTKPDGTGPVGLPDYFTDLNAMAAAEKTLTYEQAEAYAATLCEEGGPVIEMSAFDTFVCITQTAEQRAEAFGLTLNLWDR